MKKILVSFFFIMAISIYSEEQTAPQEESQPQNNQAMNNSLSGTGNIPRAKKQRFVDDSKANLSKFEEEATMEREKQLEQLKNKTSSTKKDILFDITTTHGKVLIERKTADPDQIKDIYQLKAQGDPQADGQSAPGGSSPGQPPAGSQYGGGGGYGAQR